MLPPASTRIKCKCSVAIVLAVLVHASTYISCYHTSCCKHLCERCLNQSFNFHVIPGIFSCDEHIGTFGSGILGNIVLLYDDGEWRCKYVSLFT